MPSHFNRSSFDDLIKHGTLHLGFLVGKVRYQVEIFAADTTQLSEAYCFVDIHLNINFIATRKTVTPATYKYICDALRIIHETPWLKISTDLTAFQLEHPFQKITIAVTLLSNPHE